MSKHLKTLIVIVTTIGLLAGCTGQPDPIDRSIETNVPEITPKVTEPVISTTVEPTPEITLEPTPDKKPVPTPHSINEQDIPFVESGTFVGGKNERLEIGNEEISIENNGENITIIIPAYKIIAGEYSIADDVFPYTLETFEYPKYLLLTIKTHQLYVSFPRVSSGYITMEKYPEEEVGWHSYIITANEDIEFRVYDEKSPGRIIIEIRKATEKKEYGIVFSVRSENADRGYIEGAWFGDILGSLRRDYGLKPRILKTETGECIEAAYFKNKAEAEKLLAEINIYDVKFYIEEMGMFDIPEDYSTKIKEEYIPTMSNEEITNYIKADVIDVFTSRGMKIGSAHIYIQDFDVTQQTIYAVIESDSLKRYYLYYITFSNSDYPTVSMEQIFETDTDKIQLADDIKKQCIKYDIEIN